MTKPGDRLRCIVVVLIVRLRVGRCPQVWDIDALFFVVAVVAVVGGGLDALIRSLVRGLRRHGGDRIECYIYDFAGCCR